MVKPTERTFAEPWEGADVVLLSKDGRKMYTTREVLEANTNYFDFPKDDPSEKKPLTFEVPYNYDIVTRILQFIHAAEDSGYELHDALPKEYSRMRKCQCLYQFMIVSDGLGFEKPRKAADDLLDDYVVEMALISLGNGDRIDVLHRVREFHPHELKAFLACGATQPMFTKCDLVLFYLVMKDSSLLHPDLTLDKHLKFLENLYGFPELAVEPPAPLNLEEVANLQSWKAMHQKADSELALITNGCNGRKLYGSRATFAGISRVLRDRIETLDKQIAAHENDLESEPEKKCSPHKVKHQKKKRPTKARKCRCTDVEKKLYETPKDVPVICLDMEFVTFDLMMTLARLSDAHEGLNILEKTHPLLIYDLYSSAHEECLDVPFIKKLVGYFLSTHISVEALDLAIRLNMDDVKTRLLHKLPLDYFSQWLQKGHTGHAYIKGGYEIRLSVPRNEPFLSIEDLQIIMKRLEEADPVAL